MVGRKQVADRTIEEWQTYRDRRITEGASLWRIASELAREHCTATVYLYLNPEARGRSRLSSRLSYRRRNPIPHRFTVGNADRRQYARLYHELSAKRRLYEKYYRRITRHPNRYLDQIFQSRTEADLETITVEIRTFTENVRFTPRTIERILTSYSTAQQQHYPRRPPPIPIPNRIKTWCLGLWAEA